MADLFRLLLDVITYLWPFRPVEMTERGVPYVLGRFRLRRWWLCWRVAPDGTVGPGRWPVIPYFTDVKPVLVQPGCFPITRQDITLRDGRPLTFMATFEFQVENAAKARNEVENWPETTTEYVAGILAERLADVEPARFDPARGKRDRLLEELRAECDAKTAGYGVRIRSVWMTTFVVGSPTYRLVGGGLGGES